MNNFPAYGGEIIFQEKKMSDFLSSIITAVVVSVVLPVVFNLFYFLKAREEKKQKIKQGDAFRTRAPTAIKAFFLGFAIAMFAAMIGVDISIIVDGDPLSTVAIVTGCFTLFASIGMIGFFVAALNYEIVDGDKIIVVRCFKKRREVEISSIARYQNTGGIISGLKAFDENGIPLFSSEGMNLNLDRLVQVLDSHSVPRAGKVYPTKEIKETPIYKRYNKKRNLAVFSWLFFGTGLSFLFLFAIMFPTINYYKFENYEVSGVISEYESKEKFVTFKLEGDESTYCINNIIYDELKNSFEKDVKIGARVSLLIGYTDDRSRKNVSQFEMDGTLYLDKDTAQRAETENSDSLRTFSYAISGIGIALLAAWVPCLICANKIKVYE